MHFTHSCPVCIHQDDMRRLLAKAPTAGPNNILTILRWSFDRVPDDTHRCVPTLCYWSENSSPSCLLLGLSPFG